MKSTPKWFLIPPAIAAILILGSVSMQGVPKANAAAQPATGQPSVGQPAAAKPAAAQQPAETAPAPKTAADPRSTRPDPVLPKTPELWQMASALAGVLLLGFGGLVVLRRLRNGPRAVRGTSLMTLRQTLRLSSKQAIHAIEFDDRILLVGEHERGLALLDSGKAPEREADEAEVAGRIGHGIDVLAGDDDGAVPKDLVIPRPPAPPRRVPAPAAVSPQKRASVGLADFRNLLQKAARQ